MAELLHEYAPRGGCKEVFEARDKEVLISGPAGTGKSRACLEKLHAVCLMTPRTRALILRKTLRSLGSTALATWRKYVIPEALAAGVVTYYGGSSEEPPQYRYTNGSAVIIGGLDNPTRIMSSEYDIVYVQEATEVTVPDLEHVNTRLRNWNISFQQLVMDCNPDRANHPLKKRCDNRKCRLIESRHEDNPKLFDEIVEEDGTVTYRITEQGAEYIAILDNLTGVRYQRLRLGLWVTSEGVIYEEFDPAVHVLQWDYDDDGNRLPLPADWPRYWVIDFGYVSPFVLQCYAVGPDGELYMYREIYKTQRLVSEHAEDILNIVAPEITTEWYDPINRETRTRTSREWIEPVPVCVICDHDTEDRRTFERCTGLGTVPAKKAISTGIDLLKARLKPDSRGYAGYYVMADAVVSRDVSLINAVKPCSTADEFGSYTWNIVNGELTDTPSDEYNHGMDCARYMVMHRDYRGTPRATLVDA